MREGRRGGGKRRRLRSAWQGRRPRGGGVGEGEVEIRARATGFIVESSSKKEAGSRERQGGAGQKAGEGRAEQSKAGAQQRRWRAGVADKTWREKKKVGET